MTRAATAGSPCAREPGRFACAVLGSWLVHLTLGTLYCWGNITPYVTSYLRWRGQDVDYEATARISALASACFGGSVYFGGWLQRSVGVRGAALAGGWTLSLGVVASAVTVRHGFSHFMLTYSLLFGLGTGLAYTAPIVCLMRWLPDRRGLASGIVVLGYGAGAFVFDPIQAALVNPCNMAPSRAERDGNYFDWEDPLVVEQVLHRVPSLFLVSALVYFSMQALGAFLLLEPLPVDAPLPAPPDLEQPLVLSPKSSSELDAKDGRQRQYTVKEMLQTWQYWLLVTNFACNTQGVFFATSFTKTFAALVVSEGLSDATLTTLSAVSALFNGMGRILWGSVCDLSSFRVAMVGMCCVQASLLATLPFCSTASAYCAWTCGIWVCVGGNFALFPAATSIYFGQRNVGSNYGLVILGQSFTMLWAPELAKAVMECYSGAALCRTTACIVLCGSLLAVPNRPPRSSKKR